MFKPEFVGVGFVFVLAFSLCAEAKPCKWIDDKGDIHYGDSVPPAYANKEVNQADKAVVKSSCPPNSNPELSDSKKEDEVRKLAIKKENEEKKRRANALRNTYSNEQEIDIALERNSALINARIESYNVQLKSVQATLADLNRYADSQSKEGKTTPQSVRDDISMTEARVSRLQLDRSRSEDELKSMKARFEEDKILYRKIIVLKPASEPELGIDTSCPCPAGKNAGGYPDYSSQNRRAKRTRTWSQY